ncbi:MAG: helicase [Deltaproteobacteria bacterium]|nr:helicase [Deltaproteobacteria bacterium]
MKSTSPSLPSLHELKTLFRQRCGPQVWQQGERLAQMDAVEGLSATESEIELRVNTPSEVTDPIVVLYPEDNEWECSCKQKTDFCAHIAAAIVSTEKAHRQGKSLPQKDRSPTRMEYRFFRKNGGLTLTRKYISSAGKTAVLARPIMSQVAARAFPMGYRPTQADLNADRMIGRNIHPQKKLPANLLASLIVELNESTRVYLDNRKIEVSKEPMLPLISVVGNDDDGVDLHLSPNPDIDEFLAPGAALCDQTLHPIGQRGICGDAMEKLPRRITYAHKDLAEFVTTVLPQLERDNYVDIRTDILPPVSRFVEPRLIMNMIQDGSTVSVLPEIVYGNPPHVKIKNGRMVYIQGTIPLRDIKGEKEMEATLRDDLNLVPGRQVVYNRKEASIFVEKAQEWSEATLDASQHAIKNAAPMVPKIELEDDAFDIWFSVDQPQDPNFHGRKATARNVLEAWREGLNLAPLEGGGFAPIPQSWLDTHGHLVLDILDARREEDKKVAVAAVPMLAKLCSDLELEVQPCFTRLAPLLDGFKTIPDTKLPMDLNGTLRNYQKKGVDWLCFLRDAGLGGILADDMGLGKTIQALCSIQGQTLVVCPTSVIHNWAAEAASFRPNLKVCVFHGQNRELDESADLIVTNYALLRIERALLTGREWRMVILDESQNIKNPGSQAARAAFRLKAEFRVAMSGTPVENRLEELWSVFNFTNPGLLGNYRKFQKRFAFPIGQGDPVATASLRKKIRPFVLRRKKDEVELELPQRTNLILHCELCESERNIYDAVRAATSSSIVKQLEAGGSIMAALEQLLRLRQAACHPALVPGHHAVSSSKIDILNQELQATIANGHKALVFSQWTGFLDLVEPHLNAAGIAFIRLDGSTRDRAGVVETFQSNDGPPVMLISLKAGGTGLNLTAADHVFLLDPWWNPAAEDQAADRTHRIGQDKPVFVYRLVAAETVEEKILALQDKKRKLAEAAIGDAGQALSITREDLIELLR